MTVNESSVTDAQPRKLSGGGQGAAHISLLTVREARWLFWFVLAAVLVIAVWPGQGGAPRLLGWDKLEHAGAFFTLTVLGRCAYPGLRRLWLAVWLTGFGALIELIQMIEILNRSASPYDVGADMIGIGLGLAAACVLARAGRARPQWTRA